MDGFTPQQPVVPQPPAQPPLKPLTDQDKNHWNAFVDYLEKTGYKGNTALDNRDTNMGKNLLERFNAQNKSNNITYNDINRVQQEIQNYRTNLVNQWKTGKMVAPDVKSEADIMPGLSAPDGWLGSKTSMHKFPVATLKTSDGSVKNYGVNTALFDKATGVGSK